MPIPTRGFSVPVRRAGLTDGDGGPGSSSRASPGAAATWVVERTASRRFPVRISVEQGGRLVFAVRAQSPWPGPGQQIFCLRETALDPAEPLEPLETVPVIQIQRIGRKLSLVLDRPTRKRCELLTVTKPRRDGTGTYEQIFLRTESGIRAHRSRSRVELAAPTASLTVVVDAGERYPWQFPGATVRRRRLPAGDYALEVGDRIAATVERKSFDNLLTDIGSVQALHHQLADLASLDSAALVVEAQYGDFLDERRLGGRWPAAHVARVLAELTAVHGGLPIVFAGSRKLANLWTARFFEACAGRDESPQLELVREALATYEAAPRADGLDQQIRTAALTALGADFAFDELRRQVPGAADRRLRRVLGQLRDEGRVRCAGAGRGARWIVVPNPA